MCDDFVDIIWVVFALQLDEVPENEEDEERVEYFR